MPAPPVSPRPIAAAAPAAAPAPAPPAPPQPPSRLDAEYLLLGSAVSRGAIPQALAYAIAAEAQDRPVGTITRLAEAFRTVVPTAEQHAMSAEEWVANRLGEPGFEDLAASRAAPPAAPVPAPGPAHPPGSLDAIVAAWHSRGFGGSSNLRGGEPQGMTAQAPPVEQPVHDAVGLAVRRRQTAVDAAQGVQTARLPRQDPIHTAAYVQGRADALKSGMRGGPRL
jgi:hypothetical protein